MRNPGMLRGALAALAGVAAVVAGCEGQDELTPKAPLETPGAAEPSPPEPMEAPAAAPAESGAAAAPAEPAAETPGAAEPAEMAGAPAGSADPEQGGALYQQYCAACHGAGGAGDGPAGIALDPRPASHADGSYMNNLSNDHLFTVIKEGGSAVGKSPLMAPWGGSLTDEQVWHVVAFVRTLAEPAYRGPMP